MGDPKRSTTFNTATKRHREYKIGEEVCARLTAHWTKGEERSHDKQLGVTEELYIV